ncbi:unnamed protein product [Hyaloperonospora brassicae]|uniref:Uncharacterized protein n=1 Tax=Hyaloperonospora brassicae TaxID=162125 RepID=A0AAV0U477_HYABA|nr:unnamed protein product [Hyaloperonospora brassicae]
MAEKTMHFMRWVSSSSDLELAQHTSSKVSTNATTTFYRVLSVGGERVEAIVRANGKQVRCGDADRDTDEGGRPAERGEPARSALRTPAPPPAARATAHSFVADSEPMAATQRQLLSCDSTKRTHKAPIKTR